MWILKSNDTSIPCTIRLTLGAKRTFGRGPQADFVVNVPLISRVHCHFSVSENGLVVEDLASTNGTFVNNNRIQKSALHAGDILTLASFELSVIEE
tara:strand:- start:922 stop:1209 length:288 start_codon:yes stop_codon:yes gene_type:complete